MLVEEWLHLLGEREVLYDHQLLHHLLRLPCLLHHPLLPDASSLQFPMGHQRRHRRRLQSQLHHQTVPFQPSRLIVSLMLAVLFRLLVQQALRRLLLCSPLVVLLQHSHLLISIEDLANVLLEFGEFSRPLSKLQIIICGSF